MYVRFEGTRHPNTAVNYDLRCDVPSCLSRRSIMARLGLAVPVMTYLPSKRLHLCQPHQLGPGLRAQLRDWRARYGVLCREFEMRITEALSHKARYFGACTSRLGRR